MDGTAMMQNHETGLWEESDGRKFIRNEFNPDEPVFIDVTDDVWRFSLGGLARKLDWQQAGLPAAVVGPLQSLASEHLRTKSASWAQHVHRMLTGLAKAASNLGIDLSGGLGALSVKEWAAMWVLLSNEARTMLRIFYREMAQRSLTGASPAIALEMDEWIAWPQPAGMQDVLTWNAETGAYTSGESELARRALACPIGDDESDVEYVARIFGWILFETYKRPLQLLGMRKDALVIFKGHRWQYFLRIPKVKAQTGDAAELWPVSEALGKSIQALSDRPLLLALQEKFDRMIVVPGRKQGGNNRNVTTIGSRDQYGLELPMEWHEHGQVPTGTMTRLLRRWSIERNIISPRTGKVLIFGAKRVRHTGGTRLAMQGTPRDEIQTIFEHDDPTSAQAYIDAVASELLPAIERADRALGGLFAGLNTAFFQGVVAPEVGEKQILVPDFHSNAPAVVGSCGSKGACPTHPFWACYGGCPHFQAWRDGDHSASLKYVQREHERWSHAEAGKERSKLGKDFEQVYAGIKDVIMAIDEGQ